MIKELAKSVFHLDRAELGELRPIKNHKLSENWVGMMILIMIIIVAPKC